MPIDPDTLLAELYVEIDDFLEPRVGPGHPPQITDSEVITLAVAQFFLDVPNDRKFLAFVRWRLAHLFPYRSHSRYFWGFRLYLLCAADGMPTGVCACHRKRP